MNEQTSKKFIFNKSMLLSLKAELVKKQEEIFEKKQLSQHKVENFKPPPVKSSDEKANKGYKKSFKDSLQTVDTEELEACRKSKLALEKKAELYEHLSDCAGSSQLGGQFLVDFNTKKQQEPPKLDPEPGSEEFEPPTNNDWTEFTDCLGRTRRCHKSDLEQYMKRDRELMRVMNKDTSSEVDVVDAEDVSKEKPLLVQKTNDYLLSLRQKWEEKERELLAKDKDVHYQDLLFDEARMHGVGYFSFSTDETERKRQMEELIKQREETLRMQQEAEIMRKKRDQLMAARVAAARARQRARAGLPPDEPKENEKDFTTCLLEFLTQQKNEADDKAKEEENKKKEEQEKERQKLREAYVREWDIGKDGVDSKLKKFRVLTQEEYVDQQRDKRIDEFAPLQTSSSDNSNYVFDDYGNKKQADVIGGSMSWSDVRPKVATPPPPDIGDLIGVIEEKGLYFSSVKKDKINYKNFVKAQDSSLIVNELDEDEAENKRADKRKFEFSGAEVAPPPTYDYYGPVSKQRRPQKPFKSDMKEAYAQGAKSLEAKASDRKLPQHYDFTFD